jgi:hypothetical protein
MKGVHSFKINGNLRKNILSFILDTNSLFVDLFGESSLLTYQDHLIDSTIIQGTCLCLFNTLIFVYHWL